MGLAHLSGVNGHVACLTGQLLLIISTFSSSLHVSPNALSHRLQMLVSFADDLRAITEGNSSNHHTPCCTASSTPISVYTNNHLTPCCTASSTPISVYTSNHLTPCCTALSTPISVYTSNHLTPCCTASSTPISVYTNNHLTPCCTASSMCILGTISRGNLCCKSLSLHLNEGINNLLPATVRVSLHP